MTKYEAFRAGILSERYNSPIDRIREDWQFTPPYKHEKVLNQHYLRAKNLSINNQRNNIQ